MISLWLIDFSGGYNFFKTIIGDFFVLDYTDQSTGIFIFGLYFFLTVSMPIDKSELFIQKVALVGICAPTPKINLIYITVDVTLLGYVLVVLS